MGYETKVRVGFIARDAINRFDAAEKAMKELPQPADNAPTAEWDAWWAARQEHVRERDNAANIIAMMISLAVKTAEAEEAAA